MEREERPKDGAFVITKGLKHVHAASPGVLDVECQQVGKAIQICAPVLGPPVGDNYRLLRKLLITEALSSPRLVSLELLSCGSLCNDWGLDMIQPIKGVWYGLFSVYSAFSIVTLPTLCPLTLSMSSAVIMESMMDSSRMLEAVDQDPFVQLLI